MSVRLCDGRCCQQFPVSHDWYWQGRRLRSFIVGNKDQSPEWTRIRQILIPVIGRRNLFACNEFDQESGTCRAYDDRPGLCRRFPYDDPCRYCGARSDAQARGVALVVT
ncbi:MAG TPA: hypothetical protein ENH89_13425 [Aurantimonas coralicida]|uniref:YkgJ family cysteine cluster protein n=1 Tax=Aurantimonas coralicida TaxID=182270 RepID=A0A9C9NH75_9HYPH|nr:hypothetical protein [Aurantimonas coralicida]